ncbi:MAG: autotransporter domain-containing protein [Mesorhizobium sp.]|nr:MAG: autotransporter domain-containing protein [Mesorhizobium sp.]
MEYGSRKVTLLGGLASTRRIRMLLASTAVATSLATLATGIPASAQSVSISGDVDPTPAASPNWNVGGQLFVGKSGTGTLDIEAGGTVASTFGFVGRDPGSIGTATVTGTGSTWTNSGELTVGLFGNGTLNVEDGGKITDFNGYIGYHSGSTGTVTVTGAGSTWTNSGWLFIGYAGGAGTLTIAAGGVVTNTAGSIDSGTATVTGAGSTWTSSLDLTVNGTLNVAAGGAVTNKQGFIGNGSDFSGTATVTGTGSTWTNSGELYVGFNGGATLSVEDGGAVSNTNGYIGTFASFTGTATATVTGADSTWTNSGALYVGSSGTATLNVEDGGAVSNTDGYIGVFASSTGTATATVTGADSSWTNSGDLYVGRSGTGTLDVEEGGAVTNAVGYIGYDAGSTGTATVTGADSAWTNSSELYVGRSGTGTLNVEDGGAVTNTVAYIGFNAGSTGTATVTGTGSTWSNSGVLYIGSSGNGTLNVEHGGAVTNTIGYIGYLAGSTGTVTVTGAGSTWANSSELLIGRSGNGTLNVEDGGAVTNTVGRLGFQPGSTGTATVTGANSTWTNSGDLYVGDFATGTLTVANGGLVSDATGAIGVTSSGTAIVTGAGSTWKNSGTFYVGYGGTGTLTVADGGAVSTGNGAGIAHIAVQSGSTGTLNIGAAAGQPAVAPGTLQAAEVRFGAGAGTLTFNHTGTGHTFSPAITGAGAIGQVAGTTILTGNSSGFTGTTTISGGVLLVNGTLGDSSSSIDVLTGGTLGGSGTVGTTTVASGGTIAPGTSIGTMTVNGNMTLQQGSRLAYEAAAPGADFTTGQADSVMVNGNVTLNGAVLDVVNAGGFGPGLYRIVDYTGTLTESNGGLTLGAVPSGSTLWIQTLTADKQINLINTTGLTLNLWNANGQADATHMGGGSGTWSNTAPEWTDATGAVTAAMQPQPGFAVFGGEAGTVTVDGSAGAVQTTGMQFASGGYVLTGDTLTLVADADHPAPVEVRVGDGSAASNGYVSTISNVIAGTDGLRKTGAGTLVLSGTNIYSGGTTIAAGTLALSGAGSIGPGSLQIDAGVFDISGISALDMTIHNLSGSGGAVQLGTKALTIVQDQDGSYGGILSGTGTFIKTGATFSYDGDGSGFTGTTSVAGGTLLIGSDDVHSGARLGGNLDVTNGAVLGGHGTVGSGAGSVVTVQSGGTLAPGASIGTLTLDGDLVFNAGASLQVEVDPASSSSDLVHVTGAATIGGGSVAHIGVDGGYKPSSTYTILTADGGVSGQFDSVTSDFAFLDPFLAYDGDDVNLTLNRNNVAFTDFAQTFNQKSTAGVLETLGSLSALYQAVVVLANDDETVRQIFDQLSGDGYPSANGVLVEDSQHVAEAVNARIRSAFGTVAASDAPVIAYGEVAQGGSKSNEAIHGMLLPATTDRAAAWATAFGSWRDNDGDGNAAPISSSTGGFLTGIDSAFGDNWRAGVIAGFSHSSFNVDDRASSGDSQNWHLGLYGGGQWGAFGLRAGAAYTWHDISMGRHVAFAGLDNSLSADYDAASAQAFAEIAYDLKAGQFGFEPFAGLSYVTLHTDGFSETGGAAALTASSTNTDVTFTTLGLRASSNFDLGGTTVTARGTLAWRHAFGDVTPISTFAFAGSDTFAIAGAPIARNAALIEAGIDVALSPNAKLGFAYQGQFASAMKQNGFDANLMVKF